MNHATHVPGQSAPDWRLASDYGIAEGLGPDAWAWEFLRRSPAYRADRAWFSETWRCLEAEYGCPPHRDFARWRRDPRAYRGLDAVCAGVDGACASVDGELLWREIPVVAEPLSDAASLDDGRGMKAAPVFDLARPLGAQLQEARRHLLARQNRLRRDGGVDSGPVRAMAGGGYRYILLGRESW
jgi:hypothetical protein